nr:ATP-binding protein [Pseudodesulfovibrio tunisiensis]
MRAQVDLGNAARERASLNEQLIRFQKTVSLGQLSAGIAHEINNPLNIILQEVEYLDAYLDAVDQDELRDGLRQVRKQVVRCSDITRRLLDFARSRKPVLQEVDLNKMVSDMVHLVRREVSPDGVEIINILGRDMPRLTTDPPLLRQALLNLLDNAVQAVSHGGVITVVTSKSRNHAFVRIKDSGPGISRDDLPRIFDPFFTTRPPGEGTGLGLSMCRRILGQLGGDVYVDSKNTQGAVFTVRLPLKTEEVEHAALTQDSRG